MNLSYVYLLQDRTFKFLQPSNCKSAKVRFSFACPHALSQFIVDICVYMYIDKYKSVLYTYMTFIKVIHFKVSELLPDIQDMQSEARCDSKSISNIHFGSDCVKRHVLKQWPPIGPPAFLGALALGTLILSLCIYIYIHNHVILYFCLVAQELRLLQHRRPDEGASRTGVHGCACHRSRTRHTGSSSRE